MCEMSETLGNKFANDCQHKRREHLQKTQHVLKKCCISTLPYVLHVLSVPCTDLACRPEFDTPGTGSVIDIYEEADFC